MNNLLSIAKNVILNHQKKNKSLPFDELWKKTASEAKIKDVNNEELISEFYMLLLQDPNFIKINDNDWTLKQFYMYSEVEKMAASNNVFRTEEFEIKEGDYENFMSKYEISELKHKGRNSETTSLDLEELDAPLDEDSIDDDDDDISDDVEYDEID